MTKSETETTARDLAIETANTAVQLATTASKTAVDLASKTAETTTRIETNMSWMMQSLTKIDNTLGEMQKAFVTSAQFLEVLTIQRDHEKRMRDVEKNIQRWGGALAITAIIAPLLWHLIFKV